METTKLWMNSNNADDRSGLSAVMGITAISDMAFDFSFMSTKEFTEFFKPEQLGSSAVFAVSSIKYSWL